MKTKIARITLVVAFTLMATIAWSQPLPPTDPTTRRSVPIDGITTLLIVGAAVGGLSRLKKNKE